MWPFKKTPPPPPPEPPPRTKWFSTTELATGDECVCINDRPHDYTHQKLLTKGNVYTVRDVSIGGNTSSYGGPFIRLVGIVPIHDQRWDCVRFKKVIKKTIIDLVSVPAGLDVEKEKIDAY